MFTYFDDRIEERFKLPIMKVAKCDGMRKGIVLKFKTFYLKIYHDTYDLYHFQAFLYKRFGLTGPEFEFESNYYNLQDVIDLFDEDNFLLGMKQKLLKNIKINIF